MQDRRTLYVYMYQFSSVQSLSHVRLLATPWTVACQASLSITNSRSLLKLMSIESVMPSNHLILCRPLLLPYICIKVGIYIYISYIYMLFIFFSVTIYHSRLNIVPCAIQGLVVYPFYIYWYNTWHLLIPTPNLSLPHTHSPLATTGLFSMSMILFL